MVPATATNTFFISHVLGRLFYPGCLRSCQSNVTMDVSIYVAKVAIYALEMFWGFYAWFCPMIPSATSADWMIDLHFLAQTCIFLTIKTTDYCSSDIEWLNFTLFIVHPCTTISLFLTFHFTHVESQISPRDILPRSLKVFENNLWRAGRCIDAMCL